MRLLVTGAWQSAKEYLDPLRKQGHEVVFQQQEKNPLACPGEWVEGIVCNGLFLHHDLDEFPNLRYLQLTSAGLDRIPLEAMREKGIEIHNARGVFSIPMAEHALWGVLTLYRQGAAFLRQQAECSWEKRRGLRELFGSTVCIVGTGNVGATCAERFRAFGCKVIGVNRTVREAPAFDKVYPMTQLDEALACSDVVVLTIALTDETRGMMNAERFKKMKPGAALVNIARGALVDDAALIDALENHLSGAVLDVFDPEPLSSESPFWGKENVIVTPHNSFVGDGAAIRLNELVVKNLEAYSL